MRRILPIGLAALALAVTAPASAANYNIVVGPGTSSTDFGATQNSPGTLDDSFTFTIPAGSANGFVGSIALTALLDVDFDRVLLDTTEFDRRLSDGTELFTLDPVNLAAGTHSIRVLGTWGATGGSYAGTLNYSPAAVPEPATWATMIGGVGLAGGAMRRRRRTVRTVAFA